MVRRIQVILTDDLDGGDAEETVQFGLDGTQYEIDLSAKNATKLRSLFAKYVGAGTRVGRLGTIHRSVGRGSDAEENRAIRAWAETKGIEVAPRGRIPVDLIKRYRADQRGEPVKDRKPSEPGDGAGTIRRGRRRA